MKNPMTTKQAQEKHQCNNCKEDKECDMSVYGGNCVESSTCSTVCKKCSSRIWFDGSWNKYTPVDFDCPSCGVANVSPYKEYLK